jgi:hypothetical protein
LEWSKSPETPVTANRVEPREPIFDATAFGTDVIRR